MYVDLQTVRRDFSLLVQIMVDTVLKKMLIERDVENAKAYTRSKISDLLQVGLAACNGKLFCAEVCVGVLCRAHRTRHLVGYGPSCSLSSLLAVEQD